VLAGIYGIHWDSGTGNYNWSAKTAVSVNTVSSTTVTFGTISNASFPSYSLTSLTWPQSPSGAVSVLYNGIVCRVSDTSFALFYNDAVNDTYSYPNNYSGSMSCQVVTVSGTTLTIGTKVNLGTSTYTQALSAVALSSTSVFLSYAQAGSAGSGSGRTKLNVVSVSGTTPTFNTSVTIEAADVPCFGSGTVDGAVAPSASQAIFNGGYFVGEATVAGTVPTFDSAPYAGQLSPIFLCTSSKAWCGNPKAYLNIGTGGFSTSTNVVDMLQNNLTVTSAIPSSPLGAQPTTAFVGYKTGQPFTAASTTIILGTTT